jgi:hypothetical protein
MGEWGEGGGDWSSGRRGSVGERREGGREGGRGHTAQPWQRMRTGQPSRIAHGEQPHFPTHRRHHLRDRHPRTWDVNTTARCFEPSPELEHTMRTLVQITA